MEVKVKKILFQNKENGYTVLRVTQDGDSSGKGGDETFNMTGIFFQIKENAMIRINGSFVKNQYGRQFKCTSWEPVVPTTKEGAYHYLSGGFVKGIGPAFAKKIVDKFGENTFDVIENSPEKLYTIKGIGKKKIDTLLKNWNEQAAVRDVMAFLASCNISTSFSSRIYKRYKENSVKMLQENPYRLADDFIGVGFKKADEIAKNMGIPLISEHRCVAGIQYVMKEFQQNGHVYATPDQLVNRTTELLGIDMVYIKKAINYMVSKKLLKYDASIEPAVYLPRTYEMETAVAEKLVSLIHEKAKELKVFSINKLEQQLGFSFGKEQTAAIEMAAREKVMILTGGPGTGKSTVLSGILTLFHKNHLSVLLAAPTGRAAKRMEETTGKEASTIHKLLCYTPEIGFSYNRDTPLQGDVLVIDECSMIDLSLMYHLLEAVPDSMRVIFVGDVDQLPSVGAGNVLRDMIDSERIPVTRLTEIHRQQGGSRIITNAHLINQGKMPDLSPSDDFLFIEEEELERISQKVVELVSEKEAQVLSPVLKTVAGVKELNRRIQEKVNPIGDCIEKDVIYRVGDRVMQIKNNYDKNVFNGDIGKIVCVKDNIVSVQFDESRVNYKKDELSELTHAWACTVHKYQGSEAPWVVIVVSFSHYMMLQRNVLYTAVTRGKEGVILVGTKKAIRKAVSTCDMRKRNTLLKERIHCLSAENRL